MRSYGVAISFCGVMCTRLRCYLVAMPPRPRCCPVPTLRNATLPRLRIGHGYGHRATMPSMPPHRPRPRLLPCRHAARLLGHCATLRCNAATAPRCTNATLPALPRCFPATTPLFAGAVATPPLCPHGPGALPRTHKGLPLAPSKLGFGTAMPRSNNLDNISKDGE